MSPQAPTAAVKVDPEYPVRVMIDGTDLSAAVTMVHIQTGDTNPSVVELGMGIVEFDDGRPTQVQVNEATRAALESMGWTPPDGRDLVTEDDE